jgi:hypothetical protein
MKRLCCLLILSVLLSIPLLAVAPAQSFAFSGQAIYLDGCSGDIFAPMSGSYVGNSSSLIFHYAGCNYVSRMADRNKV